MRRRAQSGRMDMTRRTVFAGLAAAATLGARQPDIFEAAAAGNQDRVKELLKEAPDLVDLRDDDGLTALHYAGAGGQVEMAGLLLQSGADLSGGSESPLIPMVDYQDSAVALDMATALLTNGSDANAKRRDGTSALEIASRHGNTELVRMLLRRGAEGGSNEKVDRNDYGGRYAQDLHGNPVHRDDRNGLPRTLVNQFVTVSHFDAAKVREMFKGSPALLSVRSTWDELPIEAAAHMGNVPLAQFFADGGAPVSTCTAVMLGLTGMVRKSVGADPNRVRERGAHDLPILAYTIFVEERTELAAFLLASGADANAAGFGQTPLHFAAAKGYAEIARLLLDHGAEVNGVTRTRKGPGPTALAVARQKKQDAVARLLESRGGRI
jgi:ankyrin repeat protein